MFISRYSERNTHFYVSNLFPKDTEISTDDGDLVKNEYVTEALGQQQNVTVLNPHDDSYNNTKLPE